jgi:hypothetical protein
MNNFSLADSPNGIESEIISMNSPNYKLGSWPPTDDYPIIVDANGDTVSRFSDSKWKLWPWSHQTLVISFLDNYPRSGPSLISAPNARVLRLVAAWLIYGPEQVKSAKSLTRKIETLKSLFKIVSRQNILVTELSRFPKVVETIANEMPAGFGPAIIYLLHQLLTHEESIGFCIMDEPTLRRFSALIPEESDSQTAYIPPRIWNYQISRLNEFLSDFLAHKQQIIDCFHFCLESYVTCYGSLEKACTSAARGERTLSPFGNPKRNRKHIVYVGHFSEVAERYGISRILLKWLVPIGGSLNDKNRGVASLSRFFSMANAVSLAHILNFSLMRVSEAWFLRTDCLEIERDPTFGNIYILKGVTTKTIEDGDARWITSPSVEKSVEVAKCVAELRTLCENSNASVIDNISSSSTPYLFMRGQEPWAGKTGLKIRGIRHSYISYTTCLDYYPNLMDKNELIITQRDMEFARLITPTLNSERVREGEIWPLAWHQLRRTGAVNMQASGLVSDSTIQYQLKHATRAMSLYYGKGYSSLRINQSAKNQFIKTMYEILAKEIHSLLSDRFISPHGQQHKDHILQLVSVSDSKKLQQAAETGQISWRPTLLGGCTKKGFCEYGGIDNIARCCGGDGRPPCSDALIDKSKRIIINEYLSLIDSRLASTSDPSPYSDALHAQRTAAVNAIRFIDSYEDKAI